MASPQTLFEGKFLRLLRSGHWEYVERTRASGVAVILPVTEEQKIVLVEQFRAAVGRKVVALPAGLAGDDGTEETLAAAKRELLEETGYASDDWKVLTCGPSSPGLTSEMITFYLAAPAVRRGDPAPTPEEGIEVHEVALEDLPGFLAGREAEGSLIDYKIFAALYLRAHLAA